MVQTRFDCTFVMFPNTIMVKAIYSHFSILLCCCIYKRKFSANQSSPRIDPIPLCPQGSDLLERWFEETSVTQLYKGFRLLIQIPYSVLWIYHFKVFILWLHKKAQVQRRDNWEQAYSYSFLHLTVHYVSMKVYFFPKFLPF